MAVSSVVMLSGYRQWRIFGVKETIWTGRISDLLQHILWPRNVAVCSCFFSAASSSSWPNADWRYPVCQLSLLSCAACVNSVSFFSSFAGPNAALLSLSWPATKLSWPAPNRRIEESVSSAQLFEAKTMASRAGIEGENGNLYVVMAIENANPGGSAKTSACGVELAAHLSRMASGGELRRRQRRKSDAQPYARKKSRENSAAKIEACSG